MSWEILFLLLPVAALSGWYIGRRRSHAPANPRAQGRLAAEYFQGLNYLLNEQQDKAIEVFVRMLEVDSDTVETHFALGNLFRRRGEVDRAIRIHQNIIARPTLKPAQRDQALYELGLDYMHAGLFDRAETLFQELVTSGAYREHALRQLIAIFQQEKEWEKAIEATRRLEAITSENLDPIIAQYYCELAEQARHGGDASHAVKMLRRALTADHDCVRASMLEGDLSMAADNCKAALRAYRRVEEQDPDYMSEILDALTECYQRIGKPQAAIEYLSEVAERHHSMSAILVLANLKRQTDGDEAACELLSEHLRQHPSLRGVERLLSWSVDRQSGEGRVTLQMLQQFLGRLVHEKPIYQCHNCGFTGRSLHWQCPTCKHWTTVKPIHGVEGE
ncbi:MAG: hypothetical protein AMJ69_00855 [Gammaproteobacteria bacterium SG8_47]|nr:MAG: hypothetical protein AMJ69_00855 [Gammaproteobacteria bacterium SG8_47]